MSETRYAIGVTIVAVLSVISLLLLIISAQDIGPIKHELRRINYKIQVSEGGQKKHWKKRRRRLLWSVLPFIKY